MDEDLETCPRDARFRVESVNDAETRLYYRYLAQTLVGSKYVCVVVKALPADAFVITAYLTDNVKKGRVLWPTAV